MDLNFLHILVATIVCIAIGALWYGPIFGKTWMGMMGFTHESIKAMKMTPTRAMTLGFLFTLLLTGGMSYLATGLGLMGIKGAACLAITVWACFTIPVVAGGYLWEGKSLKLFLFNASYQLVSLFAVALITVLWQ